MSSNTVGGASHETFNVYRAGAELSSQAQELLKIWKSADKVIMRAEAATGVSFLDIVREHPYRKWTDDERVAVVVMVADSEVNEDWMTLNDSTPGR